MYGIELRCGVCKMDLEIKTMGTGYCDILPCPHCIEASEKTYLKLKHFVDSVEESKKAEV